MHCRTYTIQDCKSKQSLEEFYKASHLRLATLLKKRLTTQVFSCEFCEIFQNNFFTERLWGIAAVMESTVFLHTINLSAIENKILPRGLSFTLPSTKRNYGDYLFFGNYYVIYFR